MICLVSSLFPPASISLPSFLPLSLSRLHTLPSSFLHHPIFLLTPHPIFLHHSLYQYAVIAQHPPSPWSNFRFVGASRLLLSFPCFSLSSASPSPLSLSLSL